ncbi:hypothetical protein TNCV_2463261 [Trichonephila clavipes]|nr:hypothetical protein TNCV_2463261 [Trichonephila clavipes]
MVGFRSVQRRYNGTIIPTLDRQRPCLYQIPTLDVKLRPSVKFSTVVQSSDELNLKKALQCLALAHAFL